MTEGATDGHELSASRSMPPGTLQLTRRDMLQASGAAAAIATVPTLLGSSDAVTAADANTTAAPQTVDLSLTINGSQHALAIDPRQSLLDLLRETLELTGTKKGCNTGACGACTVILNGQRINACLTLAALANGAEVITIEGLADGDNLHPMQAAFIEHDGMQCGYCTPGQILSGVSCIAEGHAETVEDIKFWMSGNICRCGAYPGIVAAVAQVARES